LPDIYAHLAIALRILSFLNFHSRQHTLWTARDATQEEVEMQLALQKSIMRSRQCQTGMKPWLGQGGRTLCVVRRNVSTVARAILKNAPILLLDEATSSLDSYSEARVQRRRGSVGGGPTCHLSGPSPFNPQECHTHFGINKGARWVWELTRKLLADCASTAGYGRAQEGYTLDDVVSDSTPQLVS
jgi:hypothetical protein